MRRPTVVLLAAVIAVGAVAAYALAASGSSSPATVKLRSTSLGKVLVDAKSHTLYLFQKDKNGKSACSGACAKNWPPLIVKGKPKAGSGLKAAKLGTTKRSDGRTQSTYSGHPLYTFVVDAGRPGSTKGEGVKQFGAEWYVVGSSGNKVEKTGGAAQNSPSQPSQPPSSAQAPYGY